MFAFRCSPASAALICAFLAGSFSVAAAPADEPPPFVPFGVYLSWERIGANAKAAGIDRWTDACKRLDALQACRVNLLWVTNMSERDLPRLIEECAGRNLRLLPSMSAIEAKVDWRWAAGSTYYDKVVPRVVAAAGKDPTLVGWVLSDEPKVEHFERLEILRKRFRELDPTRFCTTVTMWPQTPAAARDLGVPVICVDLYPFFGPNDPNGPHTDAASKSFLRRNAAAMIAAIGDRDAVGWVMGMCFSDIWGPRRYNEQWHLIGLPGSYLHWRAPTLAEMRWQVWETFRSGAKGFICYTLAPEAPKAGTENLPPPDVAWKDVLAKEPTDLGPNALTHPDGSMTPQLVELGRVYARLTPHGALLRRWHVLSDRLAETQDPGRIQTFVNPDTGTAYALVLNDDLRKQRTVTVRVGERVHGVRDLLSGEQPAVVRDFAGGSGAVRLSLRAGDGTILVLERKKPRTSTLGGD